MQIWAGPHLRVAGRELPAQPGSSGAWGQLDLPLPGMELLGDLGLARQQCGPPTAWANQEQFALSQCLHVQYSTLVNALFYSTGIYRY